MAEKDTNGKRPSEKHERDPKESIPLWLQGLAENDQPDQTEPFTPPAETSAEENGEDNEETAAAADPPMGHTDDIEALPDWLDEIVTEDESAETTPEPDEDVESELKPAKADEPTDEVVVEQREGQEEDLSSGSEKVVEAEEEPETTTDDAPFVDISDMDVEDEMLPEEEDLPDWLTDMITEEETDKQKPARKAPADTEQTLTPERESEADNLDEEAGWQHLEDTPADWMPFDDSTPVNQPDDEIPEWLIEESEEDTSPIVVNDSEEEEGEEEEKEIEAAESVTEDTGSFVPIEPIELPEPALPPAEPDRNITDEAVLTEEEPESEPEESRDAMPKALRFAKFILDQGEVDRAMEIISTHIGPSDYLDEVEEWITEAIDNGLQPSAGLWEAVGDIAIVREDYAKALNAYAKSMEALMHREEG